MFYPNKEVITSEKYIHRHLKTQLRLLLLVVAALFVIISGFILNNSLNEFKKESSNQFTTIDNYLISSIGSGKQIIHGLAFLLSKTDIKSNNIELFELVHNFDPLSKKFKSIPFSSLVVLDSNDYTVSSSSNDPHFFQSVDFSKAKCLYNTKDNPLKIQIGSITNGIYSKEEIIPLGVAITNSSKNFIGSICTGLSLTHLKNQLKQNLHNGNLYNIEIKNDSDISNYSNHLTVSEFGSFKWINSSIINQSLVLYQLSEKYPFRIEIFVNNQYLLNKIMAKLYVGLQYGLVFIISLFLLWVIVRRFYINPINNIQNKITNIPEDLIAKIRDKHNNAGFINTKEYSPAHISQTISYLLDELQTLYKTQEEEKFKQLAQDIRTNMFHLMLIERHYSPLDKISGTKAAALYSNLLVGMVHEEHTNMILSEYLKQVIEYCQEYHHELGVILKLDSKHDKSFTFKYTALTETIFTILVFISRTANFDIENIIIKTSFDDQDNFPNIIIEAELEEQPQTSLGWESGAHFSCMSLFSIYLLAKENNLYLKIDQQDTKILFSLNPLNLLQ